MLIARSHDCSKAGYVQGSLDHTVRGAIDRINSRWVLTSASIDRTLQKNGFTPTFATPIHRSGSQGMKYIFSGVWAGKQQELIVVTYDRRVELNFDITVGLDGGIHVHASPFFCEWDIAASMTEAYPDHSLSIVEEIENSDVLYIPPIIIGGELPDPGGHHPIGLWVTRSDAKQWMHQSMQQVLIDGVMNVFGTRHRSIVSLVSSIRSLKMPEK